MLHMVLLHLNTSIRKILGSHTWECAWEMHCALSDNCVFSFGASEVFELIFVLLISFLP